MEAKVLRRTAKSAFTRASRALVHKIEAKRPRVEVREALCKLQGTYENLVSKHDGYSELIEKDEEYETEEIWLSECQEAFIKLEIDAKCTLKVLGMEICLLMRWKQMECWECMLLQSSPSQAVIVDAAQTLSNVSLENDNTNGITQSSPSSAASTSNNSQTTPAVERPVNGINQSAACSFRMEKPKMPKFSGDVREYAIFRSDFKHAIESKYSKRDLITILRTCLQDKPLELIKGIGTDYDAAWEYLDVIYGDP